MERREELEQHDLERLVLSPRQLFPAVGVVRPKLRRPDDVDDDMPELLPPPLDMGQVRQHIKDNRQASQFWTQLDRQRLRPRDKTPPPGTRTPAQLRRPNGRGLPLHELFER